MRSDFFESVLIPPTLRPILGYSKYEIVVNNNNNNNNNNTLLYAYITIIY